MKYLILTLILLNSCILNKQQTKEEMHPSVYNWVVVIGETALEDSYTYSECTNEIIWYIQHGIHSYCHNTVTLKEFEIR